MENTQNSPVSKEELIDIRQYFKVLLNYKWRIIIFSILVTALAILVVLSLPSKYTARATLLIESKQANIISIEEFYGLDTKSQEYYLTQIEILKSDRVSEEVIRRLNLTSHPEFDPRAQEESNVSLKDRLMEWFPVLQAFRKSLPNEELEQSDYARNKLVLYKFKRGLAINPIRKTQLVQVSYTSRDPELSAQIANEIGRVFMDSNIEAKIEVTQQASSWLNERIGDLREKLRQSEAQLQAFLQQEGLVDIQGVESLASQELAELTSQLNKARDRRVAAETLYQVARNYKSDSNQLSALASVPEISNHPTIRDVKVAEVQAERKVSELSKRYGPKHPKLKAAIAELESVKKNLRSELNQLLNGINNELKAARQAEQTIRGELEKRKVEFQALTVKNARYSELKREVQTNRELFDLFLSRQKETNASSDFNANIARFTDYASPPLAPSKPNRKMIVILAFLASLSFGCVMAFVADAVNDTFTDIKQVSKQLSLEILGIVPALKTKRPLDGKAYFDERNRQLTEAVRTVRTGYLLANSNKSNSVVMVTSSQPDEGKTTSALNLALSLAQMEKTLLIDCDLRKPTVSRRFGLPSAQPGVTNILTKTHAIEDCIYHDEESELDILAAGTYTNNPLELISSTGFGDFVEQLRTKYDRIIIDTPPCLAVSDAFMLSRYVDSAVIVINASHTRTKTVRDVVGKLAQQGTRIDGVILNKLNVKKASAYSGYKQYQSYYGVENA
ncbi:exopolysaccharide regulatory tyrosine autokinase VpsO [Vibrio coralliilyticus]|uniref:exopolysaccharide regulatory tyrosine autokinase VpsO n=1 Tax=Vibrio coralliilyticus TaxID=190893 RepID=UPI000BAA9C33|nr:exopolysaccharide regulatory tyrosine autokinase VpsO [Vibrio coralliilyticus]MCC2521865.1 exopolysaccharide regulatory tyrosine autokinase VpsO [Vibrio coralliilyticus]NOI28790.1 polysaccharide biosynthesis tyrosine autokinase [Vibrio coralliilyticus]NOI47684.1 polysaccharide biosynthesis tyrosine autokinase [Vibrio coralliilyticus]PAU37064.1 chain-length determining protein [Vibrio coralliilyticus]